VNYVVVSSSQVWDSVKMHIQRVTINSHVTLFGILNLYLIDVFPVLRFKKAILCFELLSLKYTG
jgi:hypothetical protein